MRRFRFRLGTLLILILVLGVGFAALRESNDTWDSGVFTLALTALLVSILLAIHRTGKRRAFWLGFALIGAVVGEFIGATQGLGYLVATAQGAFNANGVFAAMVILSVVALIADALMTRLEQWLTPWRPAGQRPGP